MSKRNKTPLKRFGYDDAVEDQSAKRKRSSSGSKAAAASTPEKSAIYGKGDFVAAKSDADDFYVGLLEEPLLSNDQDVSVFWLKTKDGVNYEWEFRDTLNARAIICSIKLRKLSKNKFRLADKTKAQVLENVKRCQRGQDPFEFKGDGDDDGDGEEEEEEEEEEAAEGDGESDGDDDETASVATSTKEANSKSTTVKAKAATGSGTKRKKATAAAGKKSDVEAATASDSAASPSPKRRPAGLKKTSTQRDRERQAREEKREEKKVEREEKKAEREEKKAEREAKKAEREAERTRKREEREERLGKWTLQPRQSVVVMDKDPFFSAENMDDIPFVSASSYSKLFITAVLTNNMSMLNSLLAQVNKAPLVFIQRSVNIRQNALSAALTTNNTHMLRILYDETSKSWEKRAQAYESVRPADLSLDTGLYNQLSLGLSRIRRINVSRGTREGNNALTKDTVPLTSTLCNPTQAWRPALNLSFKTDDITKATVDTLLTLSGNQTGFRLGNLSDRVYLILRRGNRELASGLVDELLRHPMQNGGFGSLHGKALRARKPEDLGKFRAISISKSAFNNKKVTPLHCAAINPNRAVLDSLLQIFPDFTVADEHGWKLIHYAAANAEPDCLAMLLERGISLYEVTRDGILPMHVAAKCGRDGAVRLLLTEALKQRRKREAETTARAASTPAADASASEQTQRDQEDSMATSKEASAAATNNEADMNDEEEAAGEAEDSTQLSEQRWGLAGVNRPNRQSHTPLHLAAAAGREGVLRVFAEFKDSIGLSADAVTSTGRNKQTALHLASEAGHLACVRLLTERLGADIECQDRLRRTPITLAVLNGHVQVAAYLLLRGANPNRRDSSGNTLLHYAAAYGWYDCTRLLLEHGARPSCLNDWKMSPLAIAFLKGHMGLVPLIIRQPGVDIDVVDDSGRSLLFLACASRLSNTLYAQARHLVESMGASVTLTDADGNTLLHVLAANHAQATASEPVEAVERSAQALCDLLLQRGCDPRQANEAGLRPLDVALLNHNFPMLRRLADPQRCSAAGAGQLRLSDWCEDVTEETLLHKLAHQCVDHGFAEPLAELIKLKENRDLLERIVNQRSANEGYTCLVKALVRYLQLFIVQHADKDKAQMASRGLKFIKFLLDIGADPSVSVKPESHKPPAAKRFVPPRRGRSQCYSSDFLAQRAGATAAVSSGLSPGDTGLLPAATVAKYDAGRCLELVLLHAKSSPLPPAAINAYQSAGRTVLQELLLARHVEPAARLLVRAGADVAAPSRNAVDRGETCLMSAVRLLHAESPSVDQVEGGE